MNSQTELFETAKIKALREQIDSGKMLNDKGRILAYAMKKMYFTLPDLINDLNIPHKTASGRASDLEDIGIISKAGTDKRGKYSVYKYVSDSKKQMENAHERRMKKFNSWLRRGSEFKDMMDTTAFEKLTA